MCFTIVKLFQNESIFGSPHLYIVFIVDGEATQSKVFSSFSSALWKHQPLQNSTGKNYDSQTGQRVCIHTWNAFHAILEGNPGL